MILASAMLAAVAPLVPPSAAEAPPARLVVGLPVERAKTYAPGADLFGATVTRVNVAIGAVAVETRDPEGFLARARADPEVEYAEATPLLDLLLDADAQYTPADPYLSSQYALSRVRARLAWNTVRGDPAVAICIVDTGVRYTHEDLAGPRYRGGYDFVNNDPDPMDDAGHGTHVAGIAVATADNHRGVAGGAAVGYYAVKVLDENGAGSWEDVANGITWCADHTPPRTIISLSLGGPEGAQVLADAVAYARARGKLVVAAAGNSGGSGCADDCVAYPAKYDGVLAVGCTSLADSTCSFSSRGPQVDLAAPGDDILSTLHFDNRSYGYREGTSMSAPLVSAGAALAWSLLPGISASNLSARLNATARDAGPAGKDNATGHGIVDFACLVAGTIPCPALGVPPPRPISLNATAGSAPGEVVLSWQAPQGAGQAATLGHLVRVSPHPFTSEDDRVIETGPSTSLLVTGLAPDVLYTFWVSAFNADGESDPSSAVSLRPPGAPCDVALDDFGYTCAVVDFAFEDISETGTHVTLNDDQTSGAVPIGFDFGFYGEPYDHAYISSNGFIAFTPERNGCCSGQFLPSASEPNNLIAAYWEDIYPPNGGSVAYQTLGHAPHRRFVVQWTDIPHYCCSSNHVTAQIVLHEGSDAIEIQVPLAPTDGGQHVTGIESPDGDSGLTYLFGSYSLAQAGVLFTPPGHQAPPRSLAAHKGAGGVDLAWLPPLHEQAISGYRVYRGVDGASKGPLASVGTSTSFRDANVSAGHTYRYQVVALNPAGRESVRSREAVVTLDAPLAPSPYVLLDPPQPGGLDGWWNSTVAATFGATDNGGGVARVELSLDGGETFEDGTSALLADGSYALVARATDGNGQTATSDPVFVNVDTTAPAALALGPAGPVHDTQASVVFEFSEEMDVAATEAAIEGVQIAQPAREASAASGVWYANWDDAFHLNVTGYGLGPGEYTVRLHAGARDAHGVHLAQAVERTVTLVEPGPLPIITLDPPVPDGLHGWYTVPVNATFSAQDTGTGLDPESVEYSTDNETWTRGATLALPEGQTSLWARASDPQGNVRQTPSPLLVKIDTSGPAVGVTHDIGNPRRHARITFVFSEPVDKPSVEAAIRGADGWTKTWGGRPAILAAEEGATELTLTNDSIDPGDVSVYLGEGARDAHGRPLAGESRPEPVTFTVSPTPQPPTPTVTLPTPNGLKGAFVSNTTATIGAIDNGDGVDPASFAYSLDGVAFVSGSSVLLGEGLHHVHARAASLYGDAATAGPVDVLVDLTPPTVTAKGTTTSSDGAATVVFAFSEPMDRASTEAALVNASGWSLAWSDASDELSLRRADLARGAHVLALGTAARDAHGVPLAEPASHAVTREDEAPAPPPLPEPPVGLAAALDGAGVALAWSPPATGGAVVGYNVYKWIGVGFSYLSSTTALRFVDADVTPGETHRYQVKSRSESAESGPAEAAILVPLADAPVSDVVVSPSEPDGAGGWYVTQPNVTLSATPEGAAVRYGWDGNASLDYAAPLAVPAGLSTLSWRAVLDGAPDEPLRSRAFNVDLDAPMVDAGLSSAALALNGSLTISATAADAASGIASVVATVAGPGGASFTVPLAGAGPYSAPFTPPLPGAYSVVVLARDHAGRESSSAPLAFDVAPTPAEELEPTSVEPEPAGNETGEPIGPASTGSPGPSSAPGPAPSPPPAPRVVIEGADPATGAHGNVTVRVENPPSVERSFIVVVGPDGNETILAQGQDQTTWDTTEYPDGYYTVETRERRDDGSTVTIASATVLVRHPKVSTGEAIGALATGFGVVAASTMLSAMGTAAFSAGGSAATSAATTAATTTVTTQAASAGAARSFDLFGYLRELFTDAGSDALRDRTKNVADLERRRRISGIVVVVVSAILLAVFFTYADVATWRWSEFAAALPIFGGAAVLIGLSKLATESVISLATGLRPRFKMWIAGIVSLAGSAMIFNSPFGYPGYVDREGPSNPTPAQRRIVGLQGMAIVGVTIAWALPFLVIGRFFHFGFGDVGVAMVMTAVATSAMPVGPLPGKEVWQWRKSASVAMAALGFGLYLGYTLVLVPNWAIAALGIVGLAAYALIFRHLRSASLRESRVVPVSVNVPVKGPENPTRVGKRARK